MKRIATAIFAGLMLIGGVQTGPPAGAASSDDPPDTGPAAADKRKMADVAGAVVIGTIGHERTTVPSKWGAAVDTIVPVTVEHAVKGARPGDVLNVRLVGGKHGDGPELLASDQPHLPAGEKVALFLRAYGDEWRPVWGDVGAITERVWDDVEPKRVPNPRWDTVTPQWLADAAVGDHSCEHGAELGFGHFVPWRATDGRHLIWSTTTATYTYNGTMANYASGIQAAIDRWNSPTAGGNFGFTNLGRNDAVDPANVDDTASAIGWVPYNDNESIARAYPKVAYASGNSWVLAAVDIQFDTQNQSSFSVGNNTPTTSQYDFVSVATHELGHALGHGHPLHTQQVMAPCRDKVGPDAVRALGDGDIGGKRNYYPINNTGYYMVNETGNVYAFGGHASLNQEKLTWYGASAGMMGGHKATDIELVPPTRTGYWILAANGGVFAFPNPGAPFHGSAAGYLCGGCTTPAMAAHPMGNAYWVLGSDGGVFAFPNPGAPFYGSAVGSFPAGAYATGIESRKEGNGYWIINNLGQVYAYPSSTPHYGGGIPTSAQPAKAITRTHSGNGYWILGSNGVAYGFGDAVGGNAVIGGARQMSRHPLNNGWASIHDHGLVQAGGGLYHIGNAYDGGTMAAIAVQETPTAPNLTFNASPLAHTMKRGESRQSTLTVSSNDTFFADVSFSVSGVPSGVTTSVSPNPVRLPSSSTKSSTLTINVGSGYVGSGFALTVNACGQGICRSQNIAVTVTLV